MNHSRPQATSRSRMRKQLLLPAEHGSWSWLLVPFLVGTAVTQTASVPLFLVFLGGLAAFLLRQPSTFWLRIKQGSGRRSDGPLVFRLMLLLGGCVLLCGVGLLLLGRFVMLWLAPPLLALSVVYVLLARSRQTARTLQMELVGAAGLALMAPAAMLAAEGTSHPSVWLVWGLMAAQNALGVFYVRQRIADTHERPFNRLPLFWSHLAGIVVVGGAALSGLIPWLAVGPFIGFFLRAAWAIRKPRPIKNIKRFGFQEVGVELLGGAFIAAGYLF